MWISGCGGSGCLPLHMRCGEETIWGNLLCGERNMWVFGVSGAVHLGVQEIEVFLGVWEGCLGGSGGV